YARFHFDWIRSSPLAESVLRLLTWTSLVWETFFPVLMLNRWTRLLSIAIGVGVHGGIIGLMQIHWFGQIMIATYLSILPNDLFRKAEELARKQLRRRHPGALVWFQKMQLALAGGARRRRVHS